MTAKHKTKLLAVPATLAGMLIIMIPLTVASCLTSTQHSGFHFIMSTTVTLTALWFFPLAFYLIPSMIAGIRNAPNFVAILLGNIFTGWTLIGWLAFLIWACTDSAQSMEPPPIQKQNLPPQ